MQPLSGQQPAPGRTILVAKIWRFGKSSVPVQSYYYYLLGDARRLFQWKGFSFDPRDPFRPKIRLSSIKIEVLFGIDYIYNLIKIFPISRDLKIRNMMNQGIQQYWLLWAIRPLCPYSSLLDGHICFPSPAACNCKAPKPTPPLPLLPRGSLAGTHHRCFSCAEREEE